MKRQLNLALLVTLLVAGFTCSVFAGTYSGGTGEPNDPYRIATATDLNDIGNHPEDFNKSFLMVADINLASYTDSQFNIIGNDSNAFTGVFDGNGHTVSNFTYGAYVLDVGLFGWVGSGGEIRNLGLIDIYVSSGYMRVGGLVGLNRGTIFNCYTTGSVWGLFVVGGLVGYNDYGAISNCYTTATVSLGGEFIGGLVGVNYGPITNCYATKMVSGYLLVGGLVGYHAVGSMTKCYAMGDVHGDELVGGLVGENDTDATILNCYAIGAASGRVRVGGLAAKNYGTITNSYATGAISGSESGGLVGIVEGGGTVHNSFWDIETSGQTSSAGGEGKTTLEMKQINTFANWDFVETWGIEDNQTYPFLKLTYPVGDLNHDKVVNFFDFAILAEHWLEGI